MLLGRHKFTPSKEDIEKGILRFKDKRLAGRVAVGLTETIGKTEWLEILEAAQKRKKVGSWLACWLALDCIFGKRAREICRLRWSDLSIKNNHLIVRFTVGKKSSRVDPIGAKVYFKSKTLKHYAMKYVLDYIMHKGELRTIYPMRNIPVEMQNITDIEEIVNSRRCYVFPAPLKITDFTKYKVDLHNTGFGEGKLKFLVELKPHKTTVTVHREFKNGKGEAVSKDYTYPVECLQGFRRPSDVNYYVKKVNPNIWLHLGRTTIGTNLSANGANDADVANVLDIARRTAANYTLHGTAKSKDWNEQAE